MKKLIVLLAVMFSLNAYAGEKHHDEDTPSSSDLQMQIELLNSVVQRLAVQINNKRSNTPIAIDANGINLGKVLDTFTARASTDYVKIIDMYGTIKRISVDGDLMADEQTTIVFTNSSCVGDGYTSSFNNKSSGTIVIDRNGSWWLTNSTSYVSITMLSYVDVGGICIQFMNSPPMPRAISATRYTGALKFPAPITIKY